MSHYWEWDIWKIIEITGLNDVVWKQLSFIDSVFFSGGSFSFVCFFCPQNKIVQSIILKIIYLIVGVEIETMFNGIFAEYWFSFQVFGTILGGRGNLLNLTKIQHLHYINL